MVLSYGTFTSHQLFNVQVPNDYQEKATKIINLIYDSSILLNQVQKVAETHLSYLIQSIQVSQLESIIHHLQQRGLQHDRVKEIAQIYGYNLTNTQNEEGNTLIILNKV